MYIAFTGHRNTITNDQELARIRDEYPGATWIHGGAKGFDTQVGQFAKAHNISQIVIRPDYKKFHPKAAPLIRNKEIVNQSQVLIACYDGRKSGGTFQAINYARQQGKQVSLVAIQNSEP